MEELGILPWFEYVEFRCFDGTALTVSRPLAAPRSALVAAAGAGAHVAVDVPGNVSGRVAAEVVAYWEGRAAAAALGGDAAAAEFDEGFAGGLGHDERVDLIRAAHHIGDRQLFQLFRSMFGARNMR